MTDLEIKAINAVLDAFYIRILPDGGTLEEWKILRAAESVIKKYDQDSRDQWVNEGGAI